LYLPGRRFVFGPHDATPLPATDLIRRRLSGWSAIGDSHVRAQYVIKNHQKFPGGDISSRFAIDYLVNKLKAAGLLLDKKIKRRLRID
jgi:hypothetical protein